MTDTFGTARVRLRVLDAWAASPARFREDANAEEDYAHRSYADRLVIELAQNAADASAAGGVPGRLHFVHTAQGLYAANTGAPLTAAGVESLSHLRASTKSEGAVGRFGVGFKAVLAAAFVQRLNGFVEVRAVRERLGSTSHSPVGGAIPTPMAGD